MEIQQRISQQRIQHIVDSYRLADDEVNRFNTYLSELLSQYSPGLIELALVETLTQSWSSVPMQKGIPFLSRVHDRLKQWQLEGSGSLVNRPLSSSLSPSQFSQITELDPQVAFAAIAQPTTLSTLPTQTVRQVLESAHQREEKQRF